jgi:Zn-dependent metalloprotease
MKLQTFCLSTALSLGLGASLSPALASDCVAPTDSKALGHASLLAKSGRLGSQETGGLPNFDRSRSEYAAKLAPIPGGFGGRHQNALYDRNLGLPTFLWAEKTATAKAVGALTEREQLIARAREQLRAEAGLLKLSEAMIAEAKVSDAQYNGNGPAVVRFKQQLNGVEVYGRSLNVLLDRAGKPVAVSGYFASDYDASATKALSFKRSAAQAIAAGWASLGGKLDAALLKPAFERNGYQWYSTAALGGQQGFERLPRAKALYYPRDGRLEPAYYVELFSQARTQGELGAYGLVVSAEDGGILHRRDLVARATPFSYRVFADDASNAYTPYDSPLGNGYTPFPGSSPSERLERISDVSAQMITLSDAGIGDPWLADDATKTVGNNVSACIDVVDSPTSGLISSPLLDPILNTCVALIGDIYPATTGDHAFDYAIEPDEDPSHDNAKNAAAVSLFYINNWLHDWWYQHGFNEEAGNAQTSNYGRGGEEGDPILAQGQDASGRSNANMATPADGSSPRMQQYLFDGVIKGAVQQVAPSEGQPLLFSVGSFSPASWDLAATSVVLADDGYDVATDGCGIVNPDPTGLTTLLISALPAPPQLSLFGKIALVDRGTCSFTTKARFAQLSGAAAIVVVNNTDGDPIPMGNADLPISLPYISTDFTYTTPAVMIRKEDGDAIKALLAEGKDVQLKLSREASTDLDGTLDNQIVAHEFFHYVHHRLTNSSNQQSGAMSEGWGDIDAFLLSTRPEDRLVPGNDHYQGAYGLAGYVVNGFYSGIRRAPYSTDMEKNAFTFKHISDGEATPDGGDGATNSEVHNAGEIWANAMWECYVGLLNDPRHSFSEAQSRMQDYVIAGLKMTPDDATYTEARDAILAAAYATDFQDFSECSAGFAKRGMGRDAVSPARDSTDLTGVVEDYTPIACAVEGGSSSGGTSSGGALNLLLLLPLLGLGLWRRRGRGRSA